MESWLELAADNLCIGEIGSEGWVAIRRAVQHLQGGRVILYCDRMDGMPYKSGEYDRVLLMVNSVLKNCILNRRLGGRESLKTLGVL